jgi:hypothetical protein
MVIQISYSKLVIWEMQMTDSTQPEAAKVQAPVTGPTRQGQGSERRRRFRERLSVLVARSSQDVVSSHRC